MSPRHRPAREGKCRRPCDNPGKPNTPSDAPLSQSEIKTIRPYTLSRLAHLVPACNGIAAVLRSSDRKSLQQHD